MSLEFKPFESQVSAIYEFVRSRAEGVKKHIDKSSVLNVELAVKKTQNGNWMTHEELQFFFLYEFMKMNSLIKKTEQLKKSDDIDWKKRMAFTYQSALLTMTHFLIGGLRRQVVAKMETKYMRQNEVIHYFLS